MNQSKVPFIMYELDKPRTAKLSTGASFKIRRLGINLLGLVQNAKTIMSNMDIPFEEICIILWACMEKEDSDLTPEIVGDLIQDYSSMMDAFTKVLELVNNSMPFITGISKEELDNKVKEYEGKNLIPLE